MGSFGRGPRPKHSPYRELGGQPLWVKEKNRDYSQAERGSGSRGGGADPWDDLPELLQR